MNLGRMKIFKKETENILNNGKYLSDFQIVRFIIKYKHRYFSKKNK